MGCRAPCDTIRLTPRILSRYPQHMIKSPGATPSIVSFLRLDTPKKCEGTPALSILIWAVAESYPQMREIRDYSATKSFSPATNSLAFSYEQQPKTQEISQSSRNQ